MTKVEALGKKFSKYEICDSSRRHSEVLKKKILRHISKLQKQQDRKNNKKTTTRWEKYFEIVCLVSFKSTASEFFGILIQRELILKMHVIPH